MVMTNRASINMLLMLAEKGLMSNDTLVQYVQRFIQENRPLADDEAERFVSLLEKKG